MRDKLAYDRAYRLANKERERERRRLFDASPKRHAYIVANHRYAYRARVIARMKEALNGAS